MENTFKQILKTYLVDKAYGYDIPKVNVEKMVKQINASDIHAVPAIEVKFTADDIRLLGERFATDYLVKNDYFTILWMCCEKEGRIDSAERFDGMPVEDQIAEACKLDGYKGLILDVIEQDLNIWADIYGYHTADYYTLKELQPKISLLEEEQLKQFYHEAICGKIKLVKVIYKEAK